MAHFSRAPLGQVWSVLPKDGIHVRGDRCKFVQGRGKNNVCSLVQIIGVGGNVVVAKFKGARTPLQEVRGQWNPMRGSVTHMLAFIISFFWSQTRRPERSPLGRRGLHPDSLLQTLNRAQ